MRWVCLLVLLPFLADAQKADLLSFVNPFIGTTKSDVYTRWGNEGGTYPGAVAPWGYMQLTPETKKVPGGGYDLHDGQIYAFSCTHHPSGFPNGSAGWLYVMPVRGGGLRARPFLHAEEKASPGYYQVKLQDDGTIVEAVATTRAGEFRISFPGQVAPAIFIGDTAGSAFDFSEKYTDRQKVGGGEIYSFAASASGRQIIVRVSSATSGSEGARHNIDRECAADFETLHTTVRDQWQKVLSVVEVNDDNAENKTIFYTALYHSLLVPWIVSDVDGRYKGADGQQHRVVGRNEYGQFSPWDSYRSLHPLLSLLYRDRQTEMLLSMMDIYKETGHLPVESMTGNHAIAILVDAYRKGIRGIDIGTAYTAMLKSIVRGPFLQDDRNIYEEKGYIPSTYPESVTRTVEYGYDDWVLGQYAGKVMEDDETAVRLIKRSDAYRQLLYTPSLLLLPRVNDSFRVAPGNSGYKEGDPWVYSYFAPQDAGGLIDRMGGDAYFSARLDSALSDGRIVFDNETVLHIPYFFDEAGRPDLTRKWVKKIMTERYSDRPGGLPGNDDLGAMSSWYVFSALGFFPFCPGRPTYSTGVPLFRKVMVHLAAGKTLVIRRVEETGIKSSGSNAAVLLNGELPAKGELSHAALMAGGELVFRSFGPGGLSAGGLAAGGGIGSAAGKRSKPVFVVSNVVVSSLSVTPGKQNRVSFSVGNKGTTGLLRVPLLVDGKEAGSINCLVAAGQTKTAGIDFQLYRPGEAKIQVGDIDAGVVNVVIPGTPLPEQPEVMSMDMRVIAREGERQDAYYTIKNTGWERQSFSLKVRVDEKVVGTDRVGLGPGEERSRSMGWAEMAAGWHVLAIGDKTERFRVCRSPMEAVVMDLDSTLRDMSGFGNNGEAEGMGAMLGKDKYIRIPGSVSLRNLGDRLTMLLWVYPEGDEGHGLTDIFTNGDNHVLQISGGKQLAFFAGGWGRGDCTVDLPADWMGHWHLIAGVCGEDGLSVYIDGEQRGHTPLEKSVHLFGGENTWMIGRNEEFPGQRIYTGKVRRPRIFQEALSGEDISTIYRKESSNP